MTCPNAGSMCNCTGACHLRVLNCTCNLVWGSVLPPPPCPEHGPAAPVVFTYPGGTYTSTDTVPIELVVCEHTDSPWCPRCAGGIQ